MPPDRRVSGGLARTTTTTASVVSAAEDGGLDPAEVFSRIRAEVMTVVVGKDESLEHLLIAVLCSGHALVEDVPGVGKTILARSLAMVLGCRFRRIQFTPDVLPSDITGSSVYNQQTSDFEFRPGPIFTQVLLADEINRATPRAQSALLEAMEERQVTVDGDTKPLTQPFLVLATQNPIELHGTFPLPEPQLDRILRGQHQERLRERLRVAIDRDLSFFHGLQEGRLGAGGGPVDLVREQYLGEDRSGPELEV